MSAASPLPAPLAARAHAEMTRLEVPGVAVGVLHNGTTYAAGFGVTNIEHPLPVDEHTRFRIGSTSKTFTGTALATLIESGEVELDGPVRRYLPEFRLQSEPDAAALTIRHLATHHGGFVGDYFRDCGPGDDALARIVAKMANSPQVTPAGAAFSYSNAGFYVLGRIIEAVTGESFEAAIRERVIDPLGMQETHYFAEEALRHAIAIGHVRTAGGPVALDWRSVRSIAPASNVMSSALDQLRYAALHIGETPGLVLRAESGAAMQQELAPAGSMCDAMGLSWMLEDSGRDRIVKHGGAINGQLSAFELVPAQRYACTVLTNSDSGRELRQTVADACRKHFLGSTAAPPRADHVPGLDLRQYAGRYRATLSTLRVVVAGETVTVVDETPERQLAPGSPRPLPDEPCHLVFGAAGRAAVVDGPHSGERCEFLRGADATANDGPLAWMRWDGRLARRSDD
ncbi:MAG: serine hydrolase domain-containing protein [Tepidiformaceae bacterium]